MLSTKNLPLATAYRKTAPELIGPLPITKGFYATDNYTVTYLTNSTFTTTSMLNTSNLTSPTMIKNSQTARIPNLDHYRSLKMKTDTK